MHTCNYKDSHIPVDVLIAGFCVAIILCQVDFPLSLYSNTFSLIPIKFAFIRRPVLCCSAKMLKYPCINYYFIQFIPRKQLLLFAAADCVLRVFLYFFFMSFALHFNEVMSWNIYKKGKKTFFSHQSNAQCSVTRKESNDFIKQSHWKAICAYTCGKSSKCLWIRDNATSFCNALECAKRPLRSVFFISFVLIHAI